MKRKSLVAVFVLLAALMVAVPVFAITNGVPDDGEHPYVGMTLYYVDLGEDNPDTGWYRCSGTLISPTVFLTAGHCTETEGILHTEVYVTFDEETSYGDFFNEENPGPLPDSWVSATAVPDPDYADFAGFPNTHDIGLMILDEPYEMDEYGDLADPGTLDGLEVRRGLNDIRFEVVGYGVNEIVPFYESLRSRYKGIAQLVNLRSSLSGGFNLHTSNAPGQGTGGSGTCFGDSGGPVFYPVDSNQIVAVTSFGLNSTCKGADFAYRTDMQAVYDWIMSYVE